MSTIIHYIEKLISDHNIIAFPWSTHIYQFHPLEKQVSSLVDDIYLFSNDNPGVGHHLL